MLVKLLAQPSLEAIELMSKNKPGTASTHISCQPLAEASCTHILQTSISASQHYKDCRYPHASARNTLQLPHGFTAASFTIVHRGILNHTSSYRVTACLLPSHWKLASGYDYSKHTAPIIWLGSHCTAEGDSALDHRYHSLDQDVGNPGPERADSAYHYINQGGQTRQRP